MVSSDKIQLVNELTQLCKDYPIVGVVNMESLPAQQLQKMRESLLKKEVTIKMTRKRLIKLALQNAGRGNLADLCDHVKGMPALLVAKSNPFALYATIEKAKSPAPAKGGQTAPKDIVVSAGGTNFAPGPIISELASVGIKTKVDGGKLAILADTTVAKEGEKISSKLAELLKRLDIQPMEIGLDLSAVWEDGFIFQGKDLRIDEEEYFNNFTQAASWATNLAVDIAYVCEDTISILLTKASKDSVGISIETGYLTEETKERILAKAEAQANSVKGKANL